jgi:ATPase subunit of ABC transporter with duplicated ATPase domains
MLQVSRISKSYGVDTILERVSFVVNHGERIGLVGPNGCGKTTLLRIIAGNESADDGHVGINPSVILGYLPQGLRHIPNQTVSEYIHSGVQDWEFARQEVERLARQMADDPRLLDAYTSALSRWDALGGYAIENRIEKIMAGLGLATVHQGAMLDTLSGGQRTRIGLARILLIEPDLLLLDEPTNHLDIDALEWLEQFMRDYRGAAIIVSHDATFLDRTVTRILELDIKLIRFANTLEIIPCMWVPNLANAQNNLKIGKINKSRSNDSNARQGTCGAWQNFARAARLTPVINLPKVFLPTAAWKQCAAQNKSRNASSIY